MEGIPRKDRHPDDVSGVGGGSHTRARDKGKEGAIWKARPSSIDSWAGSPDTPASPPPLRPHSCRTLSF